MSEKEFKIKFLNKKYFQKSTFFLYPLLRIPKSIIPKTTYITWDDRCKVYDMVLICKFDKFKSDAQLNTERVYLLNHELYKEHMKLEDGSVIYFFNFTKFEKIWNHFLLGKYSKFSKTYKDDIIKFYKKGSFTGTLIKSYLFPEEYYQDYAQLLDVPLEILTETGELADAPDFKMENLKFKSVTKKQK